MECRRAGDAVEGALHRRHTELPRLLRPRLHVGLVDLHDIGAGGEEVADLLIDRRGIVERQSLADAARSAGDDDALETLHGITFRAPRCACPGPILECAAAARPVEQYS